jgi:hypothetical protein
LCAKLRLFGVNVFLPIVTGTIYSSLEAGLDKKLLGEADCNISINTEESLLDNSGSDK